MEFLPIALEGIENKIKKLLYNYERLKSRSVTIQAEKEQLQNQVAELKIKLQQLEEENKKIQIAGILKGYNTESARIKVNDMLREIDKCYALLNR